MCCDGRPFGPTLNRVNQDLSEAVKIVKALVLCAGRGTRLRPLTHTRAKAAVPVAGRPVLGHILAYLRGHGLTEVGIVISSDQRELKRLDHDLNLNLTFIVQKQPKGIAHAVQTAADFLGDQPFLLYLGDNLTDEDLGPMLATFQRERPSALVAVREVATPQAFGVAEVTGDRITRVVEKPRKPTTNLAVAGIYLFGPEVLQAIATLRPSARGEYEITDAIAALIGAGRTVLAHRMSGWWQDMGSPEGLLTANIQLLDAISHQISPGAILDGTSVQGRVVIGSGTVLEGVRLRGPLLIGPDCQIRNSYIGPYTSIGEGCRVEGASVENSVLLPYCRLIDPSFHLADCLLGRGAVVEVRPSHAVTIVMGDDGRLQFPPERR